MYKVTQNKYIIPIFVVIIRKFKTMSPIIHCFIPFESEDSTRKTIASLRGNKMVDTIYLLSTTSKATIFDGCPVITVSNYTSTETFIRIAQLANTPYTLFYTKTSPLELGYRALERMTDFMTNQTGMVYANYNEQKGDSLKKHPVIDYQLGSVRDDFDFGSVLLFATPFLKAGVQSIRQKDYQYAVLYAIRLYIASLGNICHINEYLYTEIEEDLRLSGEKQFDYVNPRNREVQIEMEKAFTEYLSETQTLLTTAAQRVNLKEGTFDMEASVIIPVKNRVRTIKDAIDSVLSQQTSFPFNILIVDNHSTDGTSEAIESYASNPQVVHICPEREDLGIGGCWDLAVNHPQCGRFAVQLDSDDIYSSPNTLQRIVDEFYKEECAMLVGSYRITDFHLNTLPPGLIDHKEWTDDNGRNNALRINGLGAPRAFYTPILRKIGVPNVSYGEDYALGLAFSRTYKIGRIYDELYLCRRWEGNSDAALSIERINQNNIYKDSLRTREMIIRRTLNEGGTETPKRRDGFTSYTEEAQKLIDSQLKDWELARHNHEALNHIQTKKIEMEDIRFMVQFNPARMVSTAAKVDQTSIGQRPCFLCRENQPKEQDTISMPNDYRLCINPYPILPKHLTIPSAKHQPQTIGTEFVDHLYETLLALPEAYAVFYNGPCCGASAPDHLHFQGVLKKDVPLIMQYKQLRQRASLLSIESENERCGLNGPMKYHENCFYYLDNYLCPLFAFENDENHFKINLNKYLECFPKNADETEPKVNIFAWMENERLIVLLIPRSKHRPDCYFAQGEAQYLISPGALDMAGVLVTARPEDFERMDAQKIKKIIQEVSLTFEQAEAIATKYKR